MQNVTVMFRHVDDDDDDDDDDYDCCCHHREHNKNTRGDNS